ncbi:hypothetical protein A7U60_g3138 [Sanghuangporus baumii]|uniref:Uncharacterized protein n=1 Tax=Sanghuangporus baumii TaxID=108892 RepID=A0A9Q5I171_SANBA|nr:hypothetical protein A7U60_g3138 [Sanghuangporus baumii]
MSSNLIGNGRVAPRLATASRGKGNSKPSMLKRLKKLVRKSQAETPRQQPEASTSSMEHRRRVEALKSCGLLKQSVKYGAPYRDEEEDAKTIMSPATEKLWEEDTEDKKDLIILHDKVDHLMADELLSGKGAILSTVDEKLMPVYSASTVESDSSTLTPGHPPIRMRRIGSLTEEIDQIEDEESRRLAQAAFLS